MYKKLILSLCVAGACSLSFNASAFDLSTLGNALKDGTAENVLNGLISSSNINVSDLEGTWKYYAPAIEFESSDVLKKAGGVAASTTIEKKIAPYYKKAGLNNSSITFDKNGNFTMKFNKGKAVGTVSKSGKNFVFHFNTIGSAKGFDVKAYVKKGTTLEVTFDSSKLISLMNKIASISKSTSAASALKLLNGYDGIYAGFEFKK